MQNSIAISNAVNQKFHRVERMHLQETVILTTQAPGTMLCVLCALSISTGVGDHTIGIDIATFVDGLIFLSLMAVVFSYYRQP
jgi:hypothetical protein